MYDVLTSFFSSGSFIPHGHCYLWKPGLVWLHLISDSLIALAYYSIPLTLFYFVRKRQDLPFHGIFLLFAAFIILCGTTHLAEIWTLWHPTYWLSGALKAVTALVSLFTALQLVPLVPRALALPSPRQLEQANQALQAQIEERLRVEEELRQLQNDLEQRVQMRTAELTQVNEQLQQEIDDRQRVEAALHASRERLVLAQQIGKIGSCEWNIQTGELIWTEEMESLFGLAPGSFEGSYEHWLRRLHPSDRAAADVAARLTVTEGVDFDTEFRILLPDGTVRWVAARAQIFPDPSGIPQRLIGVNMDITDRKQAEEAFRRSEAKFRRLVDANIIGVISADTQGTITDANDAFLKMTGYTREEVLAGSVRWDKMTPADFHHLDAAALEELAIRGAHTPFEKEYFHKDGHRIPILVGSALLEDNPDNVIAFILDITERKQAEAEREDLLKREQAARAESESANRIKDEFLAILSHELRTPLNPILGWTRLLRNGNLDAEKQAIALETIERNARLQTQLIEDLLDISRILQGKLMLTVHPVELASIIDAAKETVQLAAEAKSIQIETRLETVPRLIMGDPNRLQQVMWNLLSNAVKFTPVGGQISIRLDYDHTDVQVTVKDTGKGISPKFLPYVFDYFRQADSSITRKFGGLGLGLAIVRQIVELHGGTVWAESEGEDLGATFTVRLPLMPNSPALAQNPRSSLTHT